MAAGLSLLPWVVVWELGSPPNGIRALAIPLFPRAATQQGPALLQAVQELEDFQWRHKALSLQRRWSQRLAPLLAARGCGSPSPLPQTRATVKGIAPLSIGGTCATIPYWWSQHGSHVASAQGVRGIDVRQQAMTHISRRVLRGQWLWCELDPLFCFVDPLFCDIGED